MRRGKGGDECEDVRLERLWFRPETSVYTVMIARRANTIRARETKEKPLSSAIIFARPAMSSGESSCVKASLNVRLAVARIHASAPPASCDRSGNARLASDWRFQRYVMPTRYQSTERWAKKNVRAMSGSPANF